MTIMLSKFRKHTIVELGAAIKSLDPKIINAEAATSLLAFVPDAEEVQLFREYEGPLDVLDQSSKF